MTGSTPAPAPAPGDDPGDGTAELQRGLQRMQRLLGSRRVFATLAAAAGVDLSQQAVDVLLALRDGVPRPIGDVARAARLDVAAVSRQLRVLEAGGYVRRGDGGRGSVVLVAAEPSGQHLVARIEAVRGEQLRRALSGWTAEERAQLGTLLVRLADDLHRAPYLPVPDAP
jgi:DNA-binding MarR family transcriptional regulator